MYPIKVLGIDLAKLVFSIHGIDEHDKPKLRETVKRNNLLAYNYLSLLFPIA